MHNEMTTNHTYTIGLRFPFSTSENDYPQVFKISYNTACQSDFLRTLIENDDDGVDENDINPYREIVIPQGLYEGIRHCDIEELFELWKGTRHFTGPTNKYCYEDIARLSQAILISNKLDFIRSLEATFPPKHLIPIINAKIAQEREEHDRMLNQIHNEHNHQQARLFNELQEMRTNMNNMIEHNNQNAVTINQPLFDDISTINTLIHDD